MTQLSDKLPMVILANDVPGPDQGSWTYNDYAALPNEGKRYEIVNGVLYMSPSPGWTHQEIVFEIASYLREHLFLHGNKRSCPLLSYLPRLLERKSSVRKHVSIDMLSLLAPVHRVYVSAAFS